MPTETMELELRDIHLPEPLSWWPLAPGWWMLLAGIILLICLIVFLTKRYLKKKKSAKVLARKELDIIQKRYRHSTDQYTLVKELSILLRRTAVSVFPRTDVAGLTGENWLDFLDKGIQRKQFSEGVGEILVSAPYKKEIDVNAQELLSLCKDWIEGLP